METLIERIKQYMDAGFPILYLKTFNTEKCRQIIDQVADRRILTWNVEGLFDSKRRHCVRGNRKRSGVAIGKLAA